MSYPFIQALMLPGEDVCCGEQTRRNQRLAFCIQTKAEMFNVGFDKNKSFWDGTSNWVNGEHKLLCTSSYHDLFIPVGKYTAINVEEIMCFTQIFKRKNLNCTRTFNSSEQKSKA